MSADPPLALAEPLATPDPARAPPALDKPPAFATYADDAQAAAHDAREADGPLEPLAGPSTSVPPDAITERELEAFREQDLLLPIANIQRISASRDDESLADPASARVLAARCQDFERCVDDYNCCALSSFETALCWLRSAHAISEAKLCVQECVSEFISFVTSEGAEAAANERRKLLAGEDILSACTTLGLDSYAEVCRASVDLADVAAAADLPCQVPHCRAVEGCATRAASANDRAGPARKKRAVAKPDPPDE